ncbi:uncharacterized protein LOC108870480 [Brassica rapa]|uniref:uncharacterized protein LOC108870480 n=1 Tax=Brassica campestris TaxID=3711 RepID=UPI00142E183C|nr:uncharacterized protein LOC108870480 [Brassica rapa]XP_033136841.1 uncharacterized protein LOC108870480 [Brassica rapa]
MFQFQFNDEADLLEVLDKRPYQYAKWMVIFQRWEPTTTPNFPSLIPFWIKVQGIPLHLWTEEAIQGIGKDIGIFEEAEITSLNVRMRVHVNGRLPLITSSVLKYPNGDEVVANLVYERIEKHCSCCFRLDHELRDYLKAKAAKREAQASGSDNPRDRSQAASSSGRHSRQYQQRTATTNPGRSENFDRNNGYQHNRETRHNMWYNESHMLNLRSNRDSYEKATAPRNSHNRRYQPYAQERNNLRSATYQEIYRPVQRTSNQSPPPPPLPVRDRLSLRPPVRTEPDHGESSFCQNSNPNHSKGVPFHETQLEVPAEALNVAREELRDVMVQYTSCVDPSESAARKERLRQAEENEQIEESIALMARATFASQNKQRQQNPEPIPTALKELQRSSA